MIHPISNKKLKLSTVNRYWVFLFTLSHWAAFEWMIELIAFSETLQVFTRIQKAETLQ